MTVFAFYVFATVAVASGLMVTLARNPVHSVLWLILTFFSAAGMMVLMGAEFIAMLLVIVYVGAVMVLFLFVVMMLDVDFAELKRGLVNYLPLGALIGIILIFELGLVFGHWIFADVPAEVAEVQVPVPEGVANTQALGMVIYDRYFLVFQLSGLVLLVAMIGAIVLTLRHRKDIKRQDILAQMYRGRDVELKDVEPGQGV
ncbi:MAG: NADH-quinone oxidoreductase subunit J [Pseudomonadota bacterium]